ncbi:anhydro-N-acetylmuramic acid kinase AnmK [Mucilaginibacter gynuensis]|uniref:Anhydro-N-acetylmuramic acid kinase n=1 Tax=Mucilaginibacter gynuensis TaxID=1302236 RepID=A0ABP8H1Y4_9SPHI
MIPLNTNLQYLVNIAQKPERIGIGLMSGTSLDGLDIALCRFAGSGLQTEFELLKFITIPYNDHFKDEVRQVFAKRSADMEKLCLLNAYIGNFHAELILQALDQWGIKTIEVDFIASHGQTVYHAPARAHGLVNYPNSTLQIGDGDHIAVKTGILTISDFRQKHIAAGGEGAPLALYGDAILGSKKGENRILLNMGGIANLTWLPGDDLSGIICTDIGPGNTLIDAATKKYFNKPYDEDARIAYLGTINTALLDALLDNPFFWADLPKTTGPELFNLAYVEQAQQRSDTTNISPADLITTLSAFTATGIAAFINKYLPGEDIKLFASGGGASNPFIIEQLQKALPALVIADTRALGIDPDAKEAILFALLGNEALIGSPLKIGDNPAVLMGKFSFAG